MTLKSVCCSCCSSSEGKVPLWKKLAYAVGSMPYSMTTTVIGFYFSIFLLEVVRIDPTFVVIIVFTGRVWDAITDPTVGYLTSLTKTRFGRLIPWMGLAMVPAGVTYFLLWFLLPSLEEQPQYVRFIYYLIFYFILQSLLTSIHVPYASLTMHISDDNKERDSVTFFRICFEQMGTMVGVYIFTAYYFGLVQSSEDSGECGSDGGRITNPHLRAAYEWHALTIGALIIVCVSITVASIREQKEEIEKNKRVSFFKGLKETLGFRPFRYLLMVNVFSWLGFQFLQINAAIYFKYSIGLAKQYPYVIAILLVTSILWTVLWQIILTRFGKKTALGVGMWITLPLLVFLLFLNYFPQGAYVLVIFLGMGAACAYLVPWSMLPDVVEEAALMSDVRREELFYAFFVFGNKLAAGFTLGVSTAVYKIAGYDENACEQPWTVPLTLKLLVTVPPTFFILLSLLSLHFYPITEETREKTKKLLAEQRSPLMINSDSPKTSNIINDTDNNSSMDD